MKISILVPVYNAAPYLRECMDSILSQSYADWECICVDDGSIDDSGVILDAYANRDQRIKVIHQINGGEGSARNIGRLHATGDVLTWVDADDVLDRDALSVASEIFIKLDPDMVRLCHRRGKSIIHLSSAVQSHEYVVVEGAEGVAQWAVDVLTGAGYCWATFTRRNLVCRDFPIGIQYAGDSLFMLDNAQLLNKIVQSRYVGYYYRDTPGSVMKKPFPSLERLIFFRCFRRVQASYGFPHPKFSWMGWFHLVNYARRHVETLHKRELHHIFCECVAQGAIRCRDLPLYAIPGFVLYMKWGVLWPVVCTYAGLQGIVRTRDFVLGLFRI